MNELLKACGSRRGMLLWIPALLGIVSFALQGNIYGMRFMLQLFALACACWVVFYTALLLRKRKDWLRIPARIVIWAVSLSIAVLFILFITVEGMIIHHQDGDTEIPDTVTAIFVLGCQVEGERPCEMLELRMEAAYGFLAQRPDSIAILCGGQGEGEHITEAECMYRWLTERGIDGNRLYREDTSVNTRENIENGAKILRTLYPDTTEVAVATSGYHLLRGKLLCEQAGFQAYGVAGAMPDNPVVFVNSYLREFAGVFFMYGRRIFA